MKQPQTNADEARPRIIQNSETRDRDAETRAHGRLPTADWKLHASWAVALMCLGLIALVGIASAQPVRSGSAPAADLAGSDYYVWGQVRSPGAYSFVASPDIVELISAGGGPTENANLRRVILIRAVTQKRMRIDLQKMMDSGQVARLAPGDVVIVPSSPWFYIRDGLVVLTSAASLVTVVLTIMNWAAK
jgi:hypothetical protein